MSDMLASEEGVLCHMDDVLIFGKNRQEHDARLHSVLQKILAAGVTLNKDKCEFFKDSLHFLGHKINKCGISPDPSKTAAILKMETPKTLTQLRRFMGMINQLGKFSPEMSDLSQPLRELLSPKRAWVWTDCQDTAFENVKRELTKPVVLALYDPAAETKICADASTYGLGAVLLQQQQHTQWKAVAYASSSMSDTERRYSQIEKEVLALVWSCRKFSNYILGKHIRLETDHKPLIPLLGKANLDSLPPRILRFRLHLSRFDYSISHVPGKLLYTADTLSRAPITSSSDCFDNMDMESFLHVIASSLPVNPDRLEVYCQAQKADPICSQIIAYCNQGWPSRHRIEEKYRSYWKVRSELSIVDDLLLFGTCIVVP